MDGTRKLDSGFLIWLLFFNIFLPFSFGKPDGVCVSQGGRFPPFSSEGKPPRMVSKGAKDLTLCRVFRRKTCCDVAQTYPALLSVRSLASTGEGSPECMHLWELLECSICHPRVGVQPGPPLICSSFCARVYEACSNAYFSMDAKTQVLAPCRLKDFICGRASEWVSNGTELCLAAGFSVNPSDEMYMSMEDTSCYGGKASLDSIADSWSASYSKVPKGTANSGVFEDFQQWVREMPFRERVSWAVGGMALTAGLLFISKRKSHSHRQKLAVIQRNARKLEAKRDASNQGNRRGIGR
ncbi:uncharacterized protein LOC122314754 [Carya illinoinensis]|uniref:Folate receptor-like domain-containing protein n=1 Tax=Carya illinoinensis TaxID=32201 RepID=A0A8T1PXS7_CARIL|nr:uncharacterized protein LOC122314754 [Carya illinoinensis]KAG6646654.1 hypothetical protein CIPAW_07G022700 [Carya illinoinensis]